MSTRRAWKVIPALLFLIPLLVVPTAAQDPAIPAVPDRGVEDSESLARTADNSAVVDHDGATGDPIEGATVSVDLFVTNSGTTGYYSMALPAGTHDVTGSAFGYLPTTIPGMGVNADETVVRDIGLTAAPSSVVDGYVTDAATSWPLYASIDTNSTAGVVWTDPETGYYSITLPEGMAFDFQVKAWVPGYIPEDRVVGPIGGDTTENFALDADRAACIAPGYQKSYGFFDDFGGGLGNWTTTGLWNFENEADACGSLVAPFPSSSNAVYYGIDDQCTYDTGAANSGELTLISPVTLPNFGGTLRFASFEETECDGDCDYDDRYIEISIDGGTTWDTLGEGDTEDTWYLKAFDLSAYGGDDVLIRFRFDTIDSIHNDYFGWMVDHVAVATGCEPQAGGLVVGNVYDENTLGPVVGARVVNGIGGETFALPTPGDPNVDDAFYTLFSPPGEHLFTASFMQPYGTDDATVTVVDGTTVGQDFYLPAPHLVLDTEELEVWVLTGTMVYTHPTGVDITNNGGQDLEYEIREISGTTTMLSLGGLELGAVPEGVNTDDPAAFPAVATERSIAANPVVIIQDQYPWGYDSINQVLNANGIAYDMATSGDIPTIDLSQYELVIIPSNQTSSYYTVFNANIGKFESYVAGGGKLWMSTCAFSSTSPEPLVPGGVVNATDLDSYNNVLLPSHPWVQGVPNPFSGNYASHDSLTNLVPGTLEICEAQGSGNPTLLEYGLGAGHLAVTGQTLELAWANNWEGAPILDQSLLYMYAYVTGGDVPWIWEDPVSGTVPAGPFTAETLNVDVMFTAVVTDPLPLGTYTATLKVLNNDPVAGAQDVAVIMHIVEEYITPTASFESNSPVCVETEMVFTNTTTVGVPAETDYLWDFGDGMSSTDENPVHTYADAGLYTVVLTATNDCGVDVYSADVEVIGLYYYYYLPLIQKNNE